MKKYTFKMKNFLALEKLTIIAKDKETAFKIAKVIYDKRKK